MELRKIEVKRGIFQGHILLPILVVIALIPLTLVSRKVRADFDLEKNCGLLTGDVKPLEKNKKQLDSLVSRVKILSGDICVGFCIER